MIRKRLQDRLRPWLATRVQHGLQSLEESRVPEIGLAFVTVDPVEEGRDIDELVSGIHEIKVEDVGLAGHGPNVMISRYSEEFRIKSAGPNQLAGNTGLHMGTRDLGLQPLIA